jgi:hypothetical protein
MDKRIARRYGPVRVRAHAGCAKKHVPAGQLFALLFNVHQGLLETSRYCAGGEFHARYRSDFKQALLLTVNALDLFFDHLPDALRHTHFQVAERDRQLPMGIQFGYQPFCLHIVHSVD